ncbi:hypothetical protein OG596_05575 [Streptomyces sp. NBC_01102]|nr:hypothetical protein OG596_05575 [Streptomyces sp. NBC_01102]
MENDRLTHLMMSALGVDLKVQDGYRMDSTARPPDCPFHLYYGTDEVCAPNRLRQTWAEVASGPIDMTEFPGGHFFVNTARQGVITAVGIDNARTTGVRR